MDPWRNDAAFTIYFLKHVKTQIVYNLFYQLTEKLVCGVWTDQNQSYNHNGVCE